MARFQVRRGKGEWLDAPAIPELEALFKALHDEDLHVTLNGAEWRMKPLPPELLVDIRCAITNNDFTSNQVNEVVRVLERHGLI